MDACCLNPQLDLNLQDWQCPAAICVLQWLVANRTVKLLAIISQAAADRRNPEFRSISAWANGLRLLLVNCSLVMQSPNINFQDGPPGGQQSRRPTSCSCRSADQETTAFHEKPTSCSCRWAPREPASSWVSM